MSGEAGRDDGAAAGYGGGVDDGAEGGWFDGGDGYGGGGEDDAAPILLLQPPAGGAGGVTVSADGTIVDGALASAAGSLARAGRTVASTSVGHARAAKKVDVGLLKRRVWQSIEALPAELTRPKARTEPGRRGRRRGADEDEDEDEDEDGEEEGASFAAVVSEASSSLPEGATVPFFFITLLHLANEHGIEVVGRPGLDDLGVIVPRE